MKVRFFWLYCILIFSYSTIFAQTSSIDVNTTGKFSNQILFEESMNKHELTTEDVGTFFDGFIPLQIEQANIAGAVIAVVKDGTLVFAKGYGFADSAKKIQISPEKTLFRPGSIGSCVIKFLIISAFSDIY